MHRPHNPAIDRRRGARTCPGLLLAVAVLLAVPGAAAAQTGSVRGLVVDSSGAPIFAASIEAREPGAERAAAVAETDGAGRFRIDSIPRGAYTIRVRRVGYAEAMRRVHVPRADTVALTIALPTRAVVIHGLTVDVARDRHRPRAGTGVTAHALDRTELKIVPGLAEPDVIRAVEVLPGVVSTSDFSAAFHVRGGSADQNLILIDGIPIYNPFHLGGLFSVFNSDMVERADLLAGGFPARYGGRVSSVLEVESEPGTTGFGASTGVSLLATRIAAGGDLPAGVRSAAGLPRARWRLSARRSFFDQLLKPVLEFPYHLTDLQGYTELWTPRGGRITGTAYAGEDVLDFTGFEPDEFPLRLRWTWGNQVVGGRWSAPLPSGAGLEVTAGYTRFSTRMRFPDMEGASFRSAIREARAAAAVRVGPGSSTLRSGVEVGRVDYDNAGEAGGTVFRRGRGGGWKIAGYAELERRIGEAWTLEAGVRADGWRPEGAGSRAVVSPRLAAKWLFAAGAGSVTLSAGRYTQFVHSLRDEELPIGIDVWITTGERAPHIVSDQLQAGVERTIGDRWTTSLDAYHRWFDGVVANNFAQDPNDPLDDLLVGTGRSYGADLMVRRDPGSGLSGWIALSWLRAWRTFPDRHAGGGAAGEVRYPPIFDRRVDLDLVLRYRARGAVDLGLRWNFGTGLPYTRPVGSYAALDYRLGGGGGWAAPPDADRFRAVALGPRNGERYPPYHRLDVSARRAFEWRSVRITPYLNVLNVYNRRNVLFYVHRYDRDPPTRTGVSMLPVLPTVGVEVGF